MGANTVAYVYLDTASFGGKCKKEIDAINNECKPSKEDEKKKNKNPALKKMLGAKRAEKLDNMAQKMKDKYKDKSAPTGKNSWMDNCDGLWIKPDGGKEFKKDMEEFNEMIQGMSDDIAGTLKNQIEPALEAAKEKNWGKNMSTGGLEKKAVKKIPGLGTALTLWDAAKAAKGLMEISELISAVDIVKTAQSELADLVKNAANKTPTDLMADGMGVLSKLNDCTRARRCLLRPYKNTKNPASLEGDGCCPGQSGHHVIPKESGGGCDKYNHDEAPTMCVEGANNGNGTHGKAHDHLLARVEAYKKKNKTDKASYDDMKDMGVESVQSTFPESKCRESCLKAQLDDYYKDKCKNDMPAAAGKKAPKDEDI